MYGLVNFIKRVSDKGILIKKNSLHKYIQIFPIIEIFNLVETIDLKRIDVKKKVN